MFSFDLDQTSIPYKVGGSLRFNHPTYVTRKADERLYQSLMQGEFCYVFDARQMGKSSLRVQTMHRLQIAGIVCVSIDLTSIGSDTLTSEQWYGGLFTEIVRKFHLPPSLHLSQWWRSCSHLPPIQRLSEFVEEILLKQIPDRPIVLFLDEIDSVLGLNFSTDDLFAWIRFCYNQRSEDSTYQRLSFALFGVATPPDLMRDKQRTPFNIGVAIELSGFQWEEINPLTEGLKSFAESPTNVLKEILYWTAGQPFLTQKVCQLVCMLPFKIELGKEFAQISQLVQNQIVQNWEFEDEPEHLRTIRNSILQSTDKSGRLLGIYQKILMSDYPVIDDSPEQMGLLLSGLVIKQEKYLNVRNRIYAAVFDSEWVAQQLANIRPYGTQLEAWARSEYKDESQLLQKVSLKAAYDWSSGKSLSDIDYQFLSASELLDRRRRDQQILQILSVLNYRTGELKPYLAEIAKAVSELISVDWSVVTLCSNGMDQILASSIDIGEAANQMYSLHGTLTNTVVTSGKPLCVEDVILCQDYGSPPEGYKAYVGVPLRTSNGQVIGTICSFHRQPHQCLSDQIQLVSIFAERAASAIENYNLYQELEKLNQCLQAEVEGRKSIEQLLYKNGLSYGV